MTHVAYVASGYLVVTGVLVAYAWRTVRRGRRLAAQLPEQQPWEAGG